MFDTRKKYESNIIQFRVGNVADDKRLRALIRSQVRPFVPAPPASVTQVTHRKIIDFQHAGLTEAAKRQHIAIMVELLERIAYCRNIKNHIDANSLYAVFEYHNWQCWQTRTTHSERTPLTIDFLVPIFRGGAMKISNIRPRYIPGWLPGFYRWHSIPSQNELVA